MDLSGLNDLALGFGAIDIPRPNWKSEAKTSRWLEGRRVVFQRTGRLGREERELADTARHSVFHNEKGKSLGAIASQGHSAWHKCITNIIQVPDKLNPYTQKLAQGRVVSVVLTRQAVKSSKVMVQTE
ncbi:hypothetical protein KCV00_g396, partial [Aureobasidium melanogenum]